MEKREKPKRQNIMDRVRDTFDLPGEVIQNLPRITMTGGNRVMVENHQGLLDYGETAIVIAGGRVKVKVQGDGLKLCAMNTEALLITGSVFGVEFIY